MRLSAPLGPKPSPDPPTQSFTGTDHTPNPSSQNGTGTNTWSPFPTSRPLVKTFPRVPGGEGRGPLLLCGPLSALADEKKKTEHKRRPNTRGPITELVVLLDR